MIDPKPADIGRKVVYRDHRLRGRRRRHHAFQRYLCVRSLWRGHGVEGDSAGGPGLA
jgi:hypothetical protein